MDQPIYTPESPAPLAAGWRKRLVLILAIVIAVVVTALVIGGVSYFLYSQKMSLAKNDAARLLNETQVAAAKAESDLNVCRIGATTLEDQTKKIKEDAEAMARAAYAAWPTYTDSKYSLVWSYPADWKVTEKTITDDMISHKDGYCLHFTSPQEILLNVCYRQADDRTATTWFRTGLGWAELAKVGTKITMADRILDQKTYYGENGKVLTIIYAQNFKDDETGYAARFKAGNFFFTIMADDLSGKKVGISPEDQILMETILSSLKLPPVSSVTPEQPTE